MELVCCVDAGTTRLKVALIDSNGVMLRNTSAPVSDEAVMDASEFDAQKYFALLGGLIAKVMVGLEARDVQGVCVTNQRATLVPVGKNHLPAAPALSWQDTRSAKVNAEFIERFGERRFREITGLPSSALWSLAKILWLKEVRPEVFASADRFVFLQDYFLHNLGAEDFFSDYSNASVSGLLDLKNLAWSDEILDAAGIPRARMPALLPAGTIIGHLSTAAAQSTGLLSGTPLVLGGGDQQCAALGIGAVEPGEVGICLGTAAVISCPTDKPLFDPHGGFFCTAHAAPRRWVLEGIHNSYGSALIWAANLLGLPRQEDLVALAGSASPGASGVVFLPFLAGIGTPDYEAHTRAAFLGLDHGHTRSDVARAVLEGITMEIRRILEAVEPHVSFRKLHLSGGRSTDAMIHQMLSDLTGRPISMYKNPDSTLMGAGIIAWTGLKKFRDVFEGARVFAEDPDQRWEVKPSGASGDLLYNRYLRYVDAVRRASLSMSREPELD